LWQQFDPDTFATINWNQHTLYWISLAVLLLIIRHLAYATRLRILSEKTFSWRKCIELIFIWEFSSAVSPTSVGGTAVALFVIAQEKLSAAKTTTLVIYTAILDTIFFIADRYVSHINLFGIISMSFTLFILLHSFHTQAKKYFVASIIITMFFGITNLTSDEFNKKNIFADYNI
jgi:hypothetical protein